MVDALTLDEMEMRLSRLGRERARDAGCRGEVRWCIQRGDGLHGGIRYACDEHLEALTDAGEDVYWIEDATGEQCAYGG